MKYLKLFESIIPMNIPDTDEFHSISSDEWQKRRTYEYEDNWTDSEIKQLKDITKKYDKTGSCSNRRIRIGDYNIGYKQGRLLINKSKDEWYLVFIEFWNNKSLPDKPYWICDQFDSLLELIDHLSNKLE